VIRARDRLIIYSTEITWYPWRYDLFTAGCTLTAYTWLQTSVLYTCRFTCKPPFVFHSLQSPLFLSTAVLEDRGGSPPRLSSHISYLTSGFH
jgi:hypothetical protein